MHLLLEKIRWVDRKLCLLSDQEPDLKGFSGPTVATISNFAKFSSNCSHFALPSYETYSIIHYQLGGAGASQGLPSTID
jgi:hypothetical protein